MKLYEKILYGCLSGAISLLGHLVLLLFADQIPVGAVPQDITSKEGQEDRRIALTNVDMSERERTQADQEESYAVEELTKALREKTDLGNFFSRSEAETVSEDVSLPELQIPKPELKTAMAQPQPEQISPREEMSPPRPEVLTGTPDRDTLPRFWENRPEMSNKSRKNYSRKVLPSILKEGGGGEKGEGTVSLSGVLGTTGTSGKPTVSPSEVFSQKDSEGSETESEQEKAEEEEPKEGEEEKTSPVDDTSESVASNETDGMKDQPPVPSPEREALDEVEEQERELDRMDKLMKVRASVYTPEEEGYRYFRLDIKPNMRSDRLGAIEKDILFLIDCSTSISPEKLEIFKEAVSFALEYLNPNDRFNIVSFRTEPRKFFDSFVDVTPEKIKEGRKYVQNLRRHGKTDVYHSLVPSVTSRKSSNQKPLNIFLLTDGNSTVPDKPNNRTFLQKIAEKKSEHVSIYTVSAGEDVNRALLDLLAVINQGTPLYKSKLDKLQKGLLQFLTGHSEIIVADLEYKCTFDMKKHVYPKQLPHLYRSETLSLYGRIPKDKKELGFQIMGHDVEYDVEELVYKLDVREADKGSARIKRRWVSQKAFHLLIQKMLNPDPQIKAELNRLVDKYNLDIPYL